MRNKSPSILNVNSSCTGTLGLHQQLNRRTKQRRGGPGHHFRYFTQFTFSKGLLYGSVLAYVIAVCIIVLLETFVTDDMLHCDQKNFTRASNSISTDTNGTATTTSSTATFPNQAFHYNPCRYIRFVQLLWLTREECAFGRCLLASVLLGGVVGWERRQADRPAGIRTMALVSLGACLFSINSTFGFRNGPMEWDSSRVSAAIPSGVGFLGAGLIFKQADKDQATGDTTHVVHGLTTSASLWISSAVGVACAGELYFSASFSVALLLALLRFGPRQRNAGDDDDDDDDDDHYERDGDERSLGGTNNYSATGQFQSSVRSGSEMSRVEATLDPELQSLRRLDYPLSSTPARFRASLGDIL